MNSKKLLSLIVICLFLIAGMGDFAFAKGASSSSGGGRSGGFSSSSSKSSFSSSGSSFSSSGKSSSGFSSSSSKPASGFSSSGSSFSSSGKSSSGFSSSSSKPASGFTSSSSQSSSPSSSDKSGSFFSSTNSGESNPSSKSVSSIAGKAPDIQKPTYSNHGSGYSGNSYNRGSGYYNTPDRTATRDRVTVIVRDRPTNWNPPVVIGGYGYQPDFMSGMFTFFWQMELLKTMQHGNERDELLRQMRNDPNYDRYKTEANKLAAENAELKHQLASVEAEKVDIGDDDSPAYPTKIPVNKSTGLGWFGWLVIILVVAVLAVGTMRYVNRKRINSRY